MCIIVGIIIGAGIFKTAASIAGCVGGLGELVGVWTAGGVIALSGALCYAELTTRYPADGGDYVFLTQAYGRGIGFLFAWSQFWILRPANVGAMAYIFAEQVRHLAPWPPLGFRYEVPAYAIAATITLTAINVIGVRAGSRTQNVLTVSKLAGLAVILVTALFVAPHADHATMATAPSANPRNLYTAMILVLFAYGGWNEIASVAAEIRQPRRNIPRALLLGTSLVLGTYLLINLSFWRVLGPSGFRASPSAAADLLSRWGGVQGAAVISGLIAISCLGSVNGMVLTGSRVLYAAGTEHRTFGWLGVWNPRHAVPLRSLIVQAIVTSALILVFGPNETAFQRLVVFSTPVFWLFALLAAASIFQLRRSRSPDTEVYHVLGYPFTPLLFCLSCLFMLWATTQYACREDVFPVLASLCVLAMGGLVYIAERVFWDGVPLSQLFGRMKR